MPVPSLPPSRLDPFLEHKLTYNVALTFWKAVVSFFFREIRPRGAYHIPRTGPVIFFLDPLLLGIQVHNETRRKVHFLAAAKSMARPEVGYFIKMMGSIPVFRAADYAKPGTGKVYLSPDDPCLVLGDGTKFKSEFSPRDQIMLPKSVGSALAEVVDVVSDTELRIKKEFGGESGKTTNRIREKLAELAKDSVPGLDYKALPHVDQAEMYKTVYKELREGGCLGIFPEGGSHDRTDLLPLKAGVSIMALGAMANDPTCNVRIVPVGLSYFHPHLFRSRAVVEFGSAMDVPVELVEMFKEGGNKKREAVAKLLDLIYDSLKTVTIRAPDYETLMVCQAARRLYKSPGQNLSLGQVVELNKRFLQGYTHFKGEPRVAALKGKVLKYNRLVRDLGLRDHQVPNARKANWKTLSLLLYRLGLLSVWSIFALPGVILNAPIILAASILSRQKAKEALAASVVKVEGRDVMATWKVLVSLGLGPVLYSFYAVIATFIAVKARAPLRWVIWTPVLTMIALPILGYSALKFGEAGMDVLKSLRPLVVSLVPGQQPSLERVKQMRQELANELIEVINEFAPKLYKDFDQWRILVPTAQVPPSGAPTAGGLFGPTSGTNLVDGQADLLQHPMTWLDETLFGWTRSARRGTSAWAGSHSHDTSRAPTPDASDDEDAGDYEHVLGIVRSDGGLREPTSRSRGGSYADLQRLRGAHGLKPLAYASGVDGGAGGENGDAVEHRRARRESLTDRVSVERLSELEPKEDFKECTKIVNEEIARRKESESAGSG
ncbi:glycerol-3-phosphate O-acyltransferase [Vararia minispora EC-137]|uniref:Glycerol-3-phosphate O-acyltransferase n=1 Tax=Vararia minispora EC-137 TaxID=1314806 RepID=A0ACB8QKH7_9AGAM|nr:glycerol-3-phosphate O-acyltransferase [Vararia minispora EC-137]